MSGFDILDNPDAWTNTGEVMTISNPWRHFWNIWTPVTIDVPIYVKTDEDGDLMRVGFYRDERHLLGFSFP